MSEASMTEDKRSMQQFAGVAGNRHYNDLDGFRAIAAIAIVVMHVHVRGEYVHTSTWLSTAVEPLGTFVTLFFIISGFGMCCGYYDRVKNGSMDIDRFYSRRIAKILPFFALLVCIDVVAEGFSPNALWEAFADVTLMFNLLPDLNIQVIGVGWALGVIFLFYFLFPFFVFLMSTKRRAWGTFVASVVLSLSCVFHFFKTNGNIDDRRFIYQFMFFVAGGLLFLYRHRIESLNSVGRRLVLLVAVAVLPLLYVDVPAWASNVKQLVLWIPWMVFAIAKDHKVFSNPLTKFLSGISMEIYLSHLFIFQVIRICGLAHVSSDGTVSYVVALALTLAGVIAFALLAHRCIAVASRFIATSRRTGQPRGKHGVAEGDVR